MTLEARVIPGLVDAYGLEGAIVTRMAGYENHVYELNIGQQRWVLRVSPNTARKRKHVDCELAWLRRLRRHGLAVPVTYGRSPVRVSDDGRWLSVLFGFISGRPLGYYPSDRDLAEWGSVVARLHQASARALAPDGDSLWLHDHRFALELLSAQPSHYRHGRELLARLRRLPTDPENFGLIHSDVTPDNVLRGPNGLAVIDFDDAVTCWFAFDISAALFALVNRSGNPRGYRQIVRRFFSHFLQGYASERPVPDWWIAALPDLLRLSQLERWIARARLGPGAALYPGEFRRRLTDPALWLQELS